MSTIVGYLYKGQRYTPLAIKEVLIREGKIPRTAFEPRRDLGGVGYPLPEPRISDVVDAYAEVPDRGLNVFMDQPETYSDDDWPKFIFDDEVTEEEQAYFTGTIDLQRETDGDEEAQAKQQEEEAAALICQVFVVETGRSLLGAAIRMADVIAPHVDVAALRREVEKRYPL